MTITLNGTTGVVAPEFDGPLDASNLTGALPAIDGSALTGINTTPTTAQVLTATAGASAGAVGTYAYLLRTTSKGTIVEGSTYAGSGLRYSAGGPFRTFTNSYNGNYVWTAAGGTVAGTWRAVGAAGTNAYAGDFYNQSLFLRIS